MAHITICSDHKNEQLHTSFGTFAFDANGECKLEPETARLALAKYKPTLWAKKLGKPIPAAARVEEGKKAAPPADDANFGFDQTTHVSKAARQAITNGQLSSDEVLASRQKALSSTEMPKTTLGEDLIKGGGVMMPPKLVKAPAEDVSEEALPKKSKSDKLDNKKRKHG